MCFVWKSEVLDVFIFYNEELALNFVELPFSLLLFFLLLFISTIIIFSSVYYSHLIMIEFSGFLQKFQDRQVYVANG